MGINYSVEADPETTAKGMLRDRPISVKDSKEISREIKGETVADAEEFLQEVIDEETSVPMRQHSAGAGHRSPTSTAGTRGATPRRPPRTS